MALSVTLSPLVSLFDEKNPVQKELLKEHVVDNFKQTNLIGVPDALVRINFNPEEGDDILIHRIDPENALGYSVHASEEDYFNHLSQSLYEPTEEDILGGLNDY